MVTALLESIKYKAQLASSTEVTDYPKVAAQGSSLTLSPLWNASGLVGYWPFDEGTGTTATDQSGSGNSGTWSGNLINGSHYVTGKVGAYAGNFDGSTDHLSVGVNNFPSGSSALTEMAWVNLSSTAITYPTILEVIGGSKAQLGLQISGGVPHVRPCITGSCYLGSASFGTNQWVLVGFTFSGGSGGTVTTYLNGVVDSTFSAGSENIVSPTATIGTDGTYLFTGYIDDLRIYNRALSAAEMQAIYDEED
jgi:hypothetical protein